MFFFYGNEKFVLGIPNWNIFAKFNGMKEYAPAKINLFLDVIRKREDGYHDLGTLFIPSKVQVPDQTQRDGVGQLVVDFKFACAGEIPQV